MSKLLRNYGAKMSNRTKARAGLALVDIRQRHLSEFSDGTNRDPL